MKRLMRKKRGLQKKFMSVLFFTSVILLLLIFVVVNLILVSEQIRKYKEDATMRVDTLVSSIDETFNSVLDKSNNIAQSQFVVDMLKEGPKEDFEATMEDYLFIRKLLDIYIEYGKSITTQVKIYPLNEDFPQGQYIFKLNELKQKPIWGKISTMQNYGATWEYMLDNQGIPYISLYREISLYNETLGYLEISIPFDYILNSIQEVELKDGEQIVYTAQGGIVIYQSSQIDKKDGMEFKRSLTNDDCIILSGTWGKILKDYFAYAAISFFVFIMLILSMYILYKYIVSSVTKELQEFIEMLRRDKNQLLLSMGSDEDSPEDIQLIKNNFKSLLLEINEMYQNIEKINRDKKKVEMEYLQMSFNPHLLYNTLSALNWSLYRNGQDEMTNLVSKMTSYYRAVLSGGSNIITIRDEVKLIEQYLELVRISYNRIIYYDIECDEATLDGYVIKQLLQPIVENAVLHGTSDMKESYIRLSIERNENDVVFKIYNNGRTMQKEEIEKVMNGTLKSSGKRSYGILNTINRIKTYYGERFGLEIYGAPEGGTEVAIRIEYLGEEELKLRM